MSPPGNGAGEWDLRTSPETVVVQEHPGPGGGLAFAAPSPNPSQSATRLSFLLHDPGHVRLAVYDVAGREVAVLVDEYRPAGRHFVLWDGRNRAGASAAAGVYFARFETAGRHAVREIVRTR
jgi:flagellar hook assembly protein FlgD